MELLGDRESDEAYLAARPGQKYLLYFTDGGSVTLDLAGAPHAFDLRWIDIATGDGGHRRHSGAADVSKSRHPAS